MGKIPDKELKIMPLTERRDCSSFSCKSAELNDFLKNDSLKDQECMVSRTYLCCWNKNIVGYLALVADTLEVEAIDECDKIAGYLYHRYPAVKIARLAVHQDYGRIGIGKFMLLTTIGKAIAISNEIGCRYITVDSKPESIGFYKKHGFRIVGKYQHSDTPKMYLNMYPILKRV